MGYNYRGFQDSVAGELNRASIHTYNPGEDGLFQALLNRLTDYGTTNPFRKLARGVATLAKVLRLA